MKKEKFSKNFKISLFFFLWILLKSFEDHKLNADIQDDVNTETDQEIDLLKEKREKFQDPKNINRNFDLFQIRYRVKKLLKLNFSKVDDDAYKFIKIAQETKK